MRIFSYFLLVTLLFTISCTTQPAEEVVVGDTSQKEEDIQAINRIYEQWDEAWAAGDVDAILALVTDDYIGMESNRPVIVGKEAFRESQQSFFDEYSVQGPKSVSEESRLAGDWAYGRGSWSGTYIPKAGGDSIHITVKWMGISERQADGSWKISRLSTNLDQPSGIDQ